MRKSSRPVRSLLAAALLAGIGIAPALAQGVYTQTVFFGDSLTDAGFYKPTLPANAQAVTGRFTTNPGAVWAEFLADYYRTDGSPAWQLTATGIAPASGDNYAAGGARINAAPGFPPQPPTQFAPALSTQVAAYLGANGGRADPGALFTVWGGANDLFFHLNGLTTQAQFLAAAGQQVALVSTLAGAGARYILVPTIPDVGITPFGLSLGPSGSAGVSALVAGYNQTLFGGLQAAGLRVIPLDTFRFIREIAASPSTYGFVNATSPACGATPSLVCTPANYVVPGADASYAFADGVHPTTGAHRLLAQYAVSILEAPRQIAVLPHSAAMAGRARAERVGSHAGDRAGADGRRWWLDTRGDFQRYGNGEDYDGAGPALTGGVDWTSGNLVFGAFGGFGRQALDWGMRRGEFDQREVTLGGFVGWQGDAAWINGQLSYTRIAYEIDREVVLGPATRTHRGSPDGRNLGAGVQGGWRFGAGAFRHGPVIGLLAQRIQVDGYAESEPALSTSLAYPEQDFDSLIGSVGWQAAYAVSDHLQPYARLTYDREFERSAEEAYARSQSLPDTLPYAVPGLEYDRSYGTLQLGARTRVFGVDANLGASVTVGQGGGNDASVFATFGSGF